MIMTTRLSSKKVTACVGLTLIVAIGIAGCSDGNSSYKDDGGVVVVTPPPPPPPPLIEDTFGARFGVIFRTNANTEPVDPMQSDITPAVNPTIEPSKLRP